MATGGSDDGDKGTSLQRSNRAHIQSQIEEALDQAGQRQRDQHNQEGRVENLGQQLRTLRTHIRQAREIASVMQELEQLSNELEDPLSSRDSTDVAETSLSQPSSAASRTGAIVSREKRDRTPKSDSFLVVAAIDFGTMYSGYAFATRDSPTEIQLNHMWGDGGQNFLSQKTPTCLLLTKDKTFDSFGIQAEQKFCNLSEENEQADWYFFKEFKMSLYKEQVRMDTEITEVGGKRAKALMVFSMSIKYMKDKIMAQLNTETVNIGIDDVKFVLTIPAIWEDDAKQFMRKAAEEAGIRGSQLELALEPEVASIHCNHQQMEKGANGSMKTISGKYLIADLGGGTVDITVHEKLGNGSLKEICAASGGPWGGKTVNERFLTFLRNAVGNDNFQEFKDSFPESYMELIGDFEVKKRLMSRNTETIIRMPLALKEIFAYSGGSSSSNVANFKFVRDKLKMSPELMASFFQESVDKIIEHVRRILNSKELQDVDKILVVGGFADSTFVQDAFKTSFKDKQVIIPRDAGLAVLKGAVMFGFNEKSISSRVLRYTYGTDVSVPFEPGVHPPEKKFMQFGVISSCKDVFAVYARAGESIDYDQRVKRAFSVFSPHAKVLMNRSSIYRSTDKDPKFVTDESCEKIGDVEIFSVQEKSSSHLKSIEITLMFGRTEITVEARDPVTNDTVDSKLEIIDRSAND